MKKSILAFGASSSRNSINKKLASYASNQIPNAEVTLLDLNDFEMPIFSVDKERESGIPALAHQFKAHIKAADGLIISFAEHNGAYSTAFKNIFDWISRIEKDTWANKPVFLLATSPGKRGGKSVLEAALNRFTHTNDNVALSFSLPSFNENFSEEQGILDEDLKQEFAQTLMWFVSALN